MQPGNIILIIAGVLAIAIVIRGYLKTRRKR